MGTPVTILPWLWTSLHVVYGIVLADWKRKKEDKKKEGGGKMEDICNTSMATSLHSHVP